MMPSSKSPRPPASIKRNGSGSNAARPGPRRSPPRSVGSDARNRDSEDSTQYLRTVIIAPMTTGGRAYPWRVPCRFQRRSGFVALDQLRIVDAERLLRPLGRLTPRTVTTVLRRLHEMFSEGSLGAGYSENFSY